MGVVWLDTWPRLVGPFFGLMLGPFRSGLWGAFLEEVGWTFGLFLVTFRDLL